MDNGDGAPAMGGARTHQKKPSREARIDLRCTQKEAAQIKARAVGERKTLTDYMIGRALLGEPVRFLPGDEVAEMIRLRMDVGKATGMLKHSVAKGARDIRGIMEIERQYRAIAAQLAKLIKRMARILAVRLAPTHQDKPSRDAQLNLRCTQKEAAQIKARARGERKTLTEYMIGRALHGKPVRFLPDQEIAEVIRLRADVGRATGMMKHSIAKGVRDGPAIMEIERQYRGIADQLAGLVKRMAMILAGREA